MKRCSKSCENDAQNHVKLCQNHVKCKCKTHVKAGCREQGKMKIYKGVFKVGWARPFGTPLLALSFNINLQYYSPCPTKGPHQKSSQKTCKNECFDHTFELPSNRTSYSLLGYIFEDHVNMLLIKNIQIFLLFLTTK